MWHNMENKSLKIIIERAENNYSAFIEGLGGIVATGKTVDEIKMNMIEAIEAFSLCLQNRLGLFDDANIGVYMHLSKINRCKYTYSYDCLTLSLWE